MLEQALEAMESALRLLDEADAPADIGAHLDLAVCRLRDLLPARFPSSQLSGRDGAANGR